MKKIAFTICSNNYLAQAQILIESIKKHNPEYHIIIGLVDKKSEEIDYVNFGCDVIEIKEIGISDFEDIWKKYDIVELNTSVKSSMFKYIFRKYPNCDFALYFDPDIQIFDDLNMVTDNFAHSNILLTPHIITAIPLDEKSPSENIFLNYGIYNLGFLGLANSSIGTDVAEFLNWWEDRLLNYGFNRVQDGFFVDQLWINLVPIFYKKVCILMQMGFNAGPWNLHERKDLKKINDGSFLMPDNSPLVFYHFSNYKFNDPNLLAKNYDRVPLDYSYSLKILYEQYYEKLIKFDVATYSNISCYYIDQRALYLNNKLSKIDKRKILVKKMIKNLLPPIIVKVFKKRTY